MKIYRFFLPFILLLFSLIGCSESPNNTQKKLETSNNHVEFPNNHVETPHDHNAHDHGLLELHGRLDFERIPTLSLEITKDSMTGWNLKINTAHFEFTPEKLDSDTTFNEGHAHLFIDNYKMARIYSHWYHLKDLTPGEHQVRVTLNANDHSTLGYQGKEISTTVTIFQD